MSRWWLRRIFLFAFIVCKVIKSPADFIGTMRSFRISPTRRRINNNNFVITVERFNFFSQKTFQSHFLTNIDSIFFFFHIFQAWLFISSHVTWYCTSFDTKNLPKYFHIYISIQNEKKMSHNSVSTLKIVSKRIIFHPSQLVIEFSKEKGPGSISESLKHHYNQTKKKKKRRQKNAATVDLILSRTHQFRII